VNSVFMTTPASSCRAVRGIGLTVLVTLVTLVTLIASACGGSATPASAPAATGQSAAGGSAGPTPAAGGGSASAAAGGDILNVCSLVSPSQVSAITGLSVGQGTNKALASNPDQISCTYASGSGPGVRVLVVTSNGSTAFAGERTALSAGASHAAPLITVPGVGGKAVASAAGLAALAGQEVVVVHGVPGEVSGHYDKDIKLAKAVISALD